MKKIGLIFGLIWLLMSDNMLYGQVAELREKEQKRILFLIDFSGSMLQTWAQRNKLSVAKEVLNEIVDSLNGFDNLQLGMRVYGHQSLTIYNDCFDSKLEVPFGVNHAEKIKKKLERLEAKGITPIAYSLEEAAKDFPDFYGKNYIIFISDGEESCKGDPCAVAKALVDKGINLKLFVIGLFLGERAEQQLKCVGTFYNSKNPNDFRRIMTSIVTNIMFTTTVEVDLNDTKNKPVETDIPMTFHESKTNTTNVYYYQTTNVRGNPDTFRLPPLADYQLTVHTLPPIEMSDLQFTKDAHNHVNVAAAQGVLELKLTSTATFNNINNKIKTLVRLHRSPATINIHSIAASQKYLIGSYDLEILTLPRIKLENIKIEDGKTTSILVPTPGICSIQKNYEIVGALFLKKDNGTFEKLVDLSQKTGKETIALQEGTYAVIYRSKKINRMMKTQNKEFKIASGNSTFVTIN